MPNTTDKITMANPPMVFVDDRKSLIHIKDLLYDENVFLSIMSSFCRSSIVVFLVVVLGVRTWGQWQGTEITLPSVIIQKIKSVVFNKKCSSILVLRYRYKSIQGTHICFFFFLKLSNDISVSIIIINPNTSVLDATFSIDRYRYIYYE